jgi:uncharacterized protein YjbI with pentapeptide repeats
MANPEHLQILKQGVEAWNVWRDQHRDIRPDLSWATLRGVTLIGTNLFNANLYGADLSRAILIEANLATADLTAAKITRANLSEADLSRADLATADLSGATLIEANLFRANLYGADLPEADLSAAILTVTNLNATRLRGANLSHVEIDQTVFGNTDLTAVRGLETCVHYGPSTLDHSTLARSGPLPLAFLRGCGLNDWEIEVAKLYDSRLTAGQVNDILYSIYPLRTNPLIQFYGCFFSYASQDLKFVDRLYEDLQNKGVRCWAAFKDMKTGDRIRDTIDQQVRLREKLLVILSSASIVSPWVEDEVEAALEEERTSPERRTVLVPIKIDNAVEHTNQAWARTIKRMRHIGDFTHWEDNDAYQEALARLLQDLNAAERQPQG